MPRSIMTLEDLATIIKEEFNRVDGRFDRIEQRLDDHDKQFERIEQRLDNHDRQFTIIIQRLDNHDRQFTSMNHKLDDLSSETKVNREFRTLTEARLRVLESKIA